jgi:hypothetical protein
VIFGREVVAWTALVRAAIVLGTAFGLQLDPVQIGAIYIFTELALSFIARSNVTPTAAPSLSIGTAVTLPNQRPGTAAEASVQYVARAMTDAPRTR